jgi:hypothetical protein
VSTSLPEVPGELMSLDVRVTYRSARAERRRLAARWAMTATWRRGVHVLGRINGVIGCDSTRGVDQERDRRRTGCIGKSQIPYCRSSQMRNRGSRGPADGLDGGNSGLASLGAALIMSP